MNTESFESALKAWKGLIGEKNIYLGAQAVPYALSSLSASFREVLAVLHPENAHQISQIVKIASSCEIPLYPISTGKNWGYGSSSPVEDGCVVVVLDRLNKILDFDEESGVVKVEPGVSFGQLHEFLVERKSRLAPPSIGAGPDTSLIGNALEKGYGHGPDGDRASTLISLEGILADGSFYQSSNTSEQILPYYKWGVGPYLDGLFLQSNLGIITSATFSLRPRPETSQVFFFKVKKGVPLQEVILRTSSLMASLGGILVSLKLQHPDRTYIESWRSHRENHKATGTVDTSTKVAWLSEHNLPGWVVLGTLSGNKQIVKAARKVVRERLSPCAYSLWILDKQWLNFIFLLRKKLPSRIRCRTFFLVLMRQFLNTAQRDARLDRSGRRNNKEPKSGLLFFVAVLPSKGSLVQEFIQDIEATCREYNFSVLLRVLKMTEKNFHLSLPLYYDKNNSSRVQAARMCYEELYEKARKRGILPYRVSIHHMPLLFQSHNVYWTLARKIKAALDPKNILSPGRYSPYHKKLQR